MKRFIKIFILFLVTALSFAACHDKDDIQPSEEERFTIKMIDDDSTYVMNFCVGKLIYDTENECYAFFPDMLYGKPFTSGQELGNTLLLKSIPDTLKAYTDSTLVIAGTYTPICIKTENGTNCPWIECIFDAEITWAAPYKIVYGGGCDTEGAVPQSWIFDKSVSKNIDKTWYLINIFVHIVAPMRGHNIDKDVASNEIISNLNKSYAGHGISVKMENTL